MADTDRVAAYVSDHRGRAPRHCELCGATCYGRRCSAHRSLVEDGDNLDPWAALRAPSVAETREAQRAG